MAESSTILVVDDDEAVGRVLAGLLVQDGMKATAVSSAQAALLALDTTPRDLVLSDVRMPGMDGLELLKVLRSRYPELPVVLLTAHAAVPLAVEAMRAGAADFILKPFNREEVRFVIRKALAASSKTLLSPAPSAPPQSTPDRGMIGNSPAIEEARALIRRAAPSNATVLLRGETGTGKEVAARMIHAMSPRAKRPLVRLNCGALPEALFESELFGYEKGAFTGAATRKLGRAELAEGGTLFLDEVGELTVSSQAKLLRLIQEKEFERLGGIETLTVDLRIVAATHRNLEEMVALGTFREDLLYRLSVVPICLPPLRGHLGDIELLVKHFLATLGPLNGRPNASLGPGAGALLAAESWPGNVRQLQNFIERLVVLAPPGDTIAAADVHKELVRIGTHKAPAASQVGGADGLDARRRAAERGALEEALQKAKGNRTLAAQILGISRRTLYNKLESLDMGSI